MLDKKQVDGARQYNIRSIGVLYNIIDLPWPWKDVEQEAFVWATAFFQMKNDLEVDGKLGNATLALIKKRSGRESFYDDRSNGGFSNSIVSDSEIVKLPDEFIREGITATNFVSDDEPRFKHRQRRGKVLNFVIHETCGNTAQGCKNTLLIKKYGVQLILDPNGHLSCHGDLVLDRMVHANQLNDVSFGIEVVNPYSPIYVKDDDIWTRRIERQWWTWIPSLRNKYGVDRGIVKLLRKKGLTNVPLEYVTPTDMQMRALELLVPWLCNVTGVPYRFPTKGLNRRKRKIPGLNLRPRGKPGPGVVAHSDFSSHADGRYIIERIMDEKKKIG